ncbi:rod shape-determining protein MreD [Candidatus Palibaumannia cicadellinicola]|uniref:Rod shape-determining protein MreD n=1 Tax=Candidatus Palibaumannia cicadellinicola TaxID=186490 RepID=A0A2N4XX74_9GAMM|nr:rod shape-determining protein MreD [Candidatus Baumannia cicadellinicola]PLK58847.1 rod shape-determining protein MreD [Candidatus Baumannia cicadellinicola]
MNRYHRYGGRIIWVSFIIAIILQMMPCPPPMNIFWPSWLNLLFIYWVMVLPHRVNIKTGFLLGLIIDLIMGSMLGVHALALSMIAYLAVLKFRFFRNIALCQQAIIIIFLSLFYKYMIYIIYLCFMNVFFSSEIFWSSMVDGIVWPWLFLLMRKIRSQPGTIRLKVKSTIK